MTTTTTRTYAFCPMLLALCRDRSFVATCQGGEQHDIHARLAGDSARPAGARARLLRRVDGVPRVHRPRRVLPQRHRASLRHSLRSRRKCHVPLHRPDPTRPDPTRQTPLTCRRPGSGPVGSVQWNLDLSQQIATVLIVTRSRIAAATRRIELSLSTASSAVFSRDVAMVTIFLFSPHNLFRNSDQCVMNFAHSATTRSTVVGVIHEVDRR